MAANEVRVLPSVPHEQRSVPQSPYKTSSFSTRVLGIWWMFAADVLTVKVSLWCQDVFHSPGRGIARQRARAWMRGFVSASRRGHPLHVWRTKPPCYCLAWKTASSGLLRAFPGNGKCNSISASKHDNDPESWSGTIMAVGVGEVAAVIAAILFFLLSW